MTNEEEKAQFMDLMSEIGYTIVLTVRMCAAFGDNPNEIRPQWEKLAAMLYNFAER